MAEQHTSPWTLTCHPSEVAACASASTYGMTRLVWEDPELADLVAPPVTVTVAAQGPHRGVFAQPLKAYEPTRRDLAGALAPA